MTQSFVKLNGKRKHNWKRAAFIIVFLAFPLAHFAVFTLYVNLSAIIMAFQEYSPATGSAVWNFTVNFRHFFTELRLTSSIYPKAILNSVLYFPVVCFVMLPMSIISAYFLFRKIKCSKIFRFIFFLPNIIPIVIMSIAYRNMWDASFGPLNMLISKLFGIPSHELPAWMVDPKYAMTMLYIYAVWAGIGYNVVLLNGSMLRIPTEIFESARLDGIGPWREIWSIVIPLCWETISTLFVTGAMVVFTQTLHPLVVTPGQVGRTWTIGLLVLQATESGQQYYAAAMGLMCVAVGVPIVQLLRKGMSKIYDTVEV
ncbi:MAG: sugar ABC transporter permease [Clostridiales bacterium]|nr:sugar ABC transporter permease [Clostridiales bacterium]